MLVAKTAGLALLGPPARERGLFSLRINAPAASVVGHRYRHSLARGVAATSTVRMHKLGARDNCS
jgi:hypothetical protein